MVIVGVRSKCTPKAPPLAMSSYGSNFLSLLRWPKMANEVRTSPHLGGIAGIPARRQSRHSWKMSPATAMIGDSWDVIPHGFWVPSRWFVHRFFIVCWLGTQKRNPLKLWCFLFFFLCSLKQPKQANILMFDDFRW